jgi:hypothetical protein
MNPHRLIGHRLFVDGIRQPVYTNEAGQQHVLVRTDSTSLTANRQHIVNHRETARTDSTSLT